MAATEEARATHKKLSVGALDAGKEQIVKQFTLKAISVAAVEAAHQHQKSSREALTQLKQITRAAAAILWEQTIRSMFHKSI